MLLFMTSCWVMQGSYELLRNLAGSRWWVSRETQIISNVSLICGYIVHWILRALGAHVHTQVCKSPRGCPRPTAPAPGPSRLLQSRPQGWEMNVISRLSCLPLNVQKPVLKKANTKMRKTPFSRGETFH